MNLLRTAEPDVEIAAITFDLDDTLWPVRPVIQAAEQSLHEWFRNHAPAVAERFTVADLARLRAEVGERRPDIAHDLSALRHASLEEAARQAGVDPAIASEAFQVFFAARNRVQFYPEVPRVLPQLARRHPLAALTNGNACLQRTGAGRWLSFAISAIDAGAPKPDTRMFQAAADRLGLPPERILHVGDDPEHDLLGARRAGFQAVLVDRHGSLATEEVNQPVLRTLDELPGLLANR